MTQVPQRECDPDVTRHEVPALRRAPLDERLPRLNCAPQPVVWQPLPPTKIEAEKTIIGEIPVLSLGDAATEFPDTASDSARAQSNSVTAQQAANWIPTDRWVLLAIAVATLGYSLRSTLASNTVIPPQQPPAFTANPITPASLADPASLYSMRTLEPATISGLPLEPTALETAAAQAWFAGHVEEAAQLYEQLATLSPEAPSFNAAATILHSNLTTATHEAQR